MCVVWAGEWYEAPGPVRAYKIVRVDHGRLVSQFYPYDRVHQNRRDTGSGYFPTEGGVLHYEFGKTIVVDKPGVYMYLGCVPGLPKKSPKIELEIPAGTLCRRGDQSGWHTINALCVTPIRLLTTSAY